MLVSVIIPSFNSKHTIFRAINSVLNQSYTNFEIIIVDDCSTDGGWELLIEKYGHNDKFCIMRTSVNSGAGISRALALSIAKGNYFAFLDADDEWLQEKLSLQIEVVNKLNADIVYSAYEIVDDNKILAKIMPKNTLTLKDFYFQNPIATSTALVSKDLLGVLEMPEIRYRQDYAYWWIIFSKNDCLAVGIENTLMYYHRTKNSLSSNAIKNIKNNFVMFRSVLNKSIFKTCFFILGNISNRLLKSLSILNQRYLQTK